MSRTNASEPQYHRRVGRPWDIQRLFESPSSQCIVMHGLLGLERRPVRRKGFPASYSLLGAIEGSFPNADLKTWELFSVTLTSCSIAWEDFWEEEQLWTEKKGILFCFFFNCGENMRPTFLTSSEGYSMAFYLWGRTSCKSSILSQNSCCCSSSGGLNSHWNHSKRRCVTGEESARKSPSSTLTSCCLMVSWKSHSRGELILASLTNHIIKLWSVFSS